MIMRSKLGRTGRILAILALAGMAFGCVSRGAYQKVVDERDAAITDRDKLSVENRSLRTRIGNVNQEILDQGAVIQVQDAIIDEEAAVIESQAAALAAVDGTRAAVVAILEYQINDGTVVVEVEDGVLLINLSAEILFASGSSQLGPDGGEVLGQLAVELAKLPYQVVVGGYTDNVPIGAALRARYPTNWDLAGARAVSVVRFLQDQGVPGSRLVAASFGPNQPVASNDTPSGRARNRRIELRVTPVVAP